MRVSGHSMAPLVNPGELVFVSERAYARRVPHRGEVVAARPASLGGRALLKRLVGLPDDRIEIGGSTWQLGDDQFFLLGDQPDDSLDSRAFGPVRREELIGVVRARVWPWQIITGRPAQEG